MGACHLQSPVCLSAHVTEAAITDSDLPLDVRKGRQTVECVYVCEEVLSYGVHEQLKEMCVVEDTRKIKCNL